MRHVYLFAHELSGDLVLSYYRSNSDAVPGAVMNANTQSLIDKINALPSERIDEVKDFVDFISVRAQGGTLRRASVAASARAFERVWDNPEDGVYDAL